MRLISTLLFLATTTLTGCANIADPNPADPFESFNRGVFNFNDSIDKAALKPLAQSYDTAMPAVGKTLIRNFFSNLDDVVVTANDLLQLKFKQAFSDGSRVVFNSTFGMLGLIDVTSRLEKHNEDFGQTLGFWGVPSGPYLMLPLLGPSSLRDATGLAVDTVPSQMKQINPISTRGAAYTVKAIDSRSRYLSAEKFLDEAGLDRYDFLRSAYLERRQSLVYDGEPPRKKFEEEDFDTPGDTPTAAPAPTTSITP
jgi:phospholipid-binding lipoprotein MlaA